MKTGKALTFRSILISYLVLCLAISQLRSSVTAVRSFMCRKKYEIQLHCV